MEGQRESQIVGRCGATWSPKVAVTAVMVTGTIALLAAVVQHGRRANALRREGPVPQWNLAYWIAIAVAALRAFARGSLVPD